MPAARKLVMVAAAFLVAFVLPAVSAQAITARPGPAAVTETAFGSTGTESGVTGQILNVDTGWGH
ncbi:hypothetical protein [Kitasatospora sp. NBC_01266]|uniref:hypothetical protein n=1 Tax=Kitasatospora sp. NBC_01266 TaxID=2903572 RepID=UPI002E35BCFE|nr:hypothetical protein [Kitasatospora sp. NBC_01266]